MDINNFVYYIRYRLNNPAVFILFPNIVNNGICAYYQQHVQHVLPRSVGSFERFVGKNWGSLWHDSRKCNALHKYFMQNVSAFSHPDKYLTYDVPDELRVSVNFFAVMPDVVQVCLPFMIFIITNRIVLLINNRFRYFPTSHYQKPFLSFDLQFLTAVFLGPKVFVFSSRLSRL